jgi:uncharacterized protein YaaQ
MAKKLLTAAMFLARVNTTTIIGTVDAELSAKVKEAVSAGAKSVTKIMTKRLKSAQKGRRRFSWHFVRFA